LTSAFFRASVHFSLGDGNIFWFWTDPWLQRQCIADIAPDLLGAVPLR
jgi:hypothetical protein